MQFLYEYGIKLNVGGLYFDTTVTNTGNTKATIHRITYDLGKYILELACRHHVTELRISHFHKHVTHEEKLEVVVENVCKVNDVKCGPYPRLNEQRLFKIQDLTLDVKAHFVKIKVLKRHQETEWTEKSLIENRGCISISDNDYICPYHRFSFGIGWVPPRRCCHPMHQLSVSKKSFTVRSISINMSKNVSKYYNKSVPVGSVFCHNHLKSERILNQTKTSTAAQRRAS
nr:uncharacterized protein LOC124819057 [Hydra vulgaris]